MKAIFFKTQGFTLVELMIAVMVVGILAAIAVPSYQESLRKSRRADAQGALLNFSNAMERQFTANNNYCGLSQAGDDSCGDGGEFDSGGEPFASVYGPTGQTGQYYQFIIFAADKTSFQLRAIPRDGSPQVGDGVLALDSDGTRHWDVDNDGVLEDSDEEKVWH